MTPEYLSAPETIGAARDATDDIGGGTVLPPHYLDQLRRAESELTTGLREVAAMYDAVVAPVERELDDVRVSHELAIAQTLGAIDSELRTAGSAHFTALDKAIDTATRDLYAAQYDVRSNGVPIPYTIEDIRAQLNDETGNALLGMLTGQPPPDDARAFTVTSNNPPPTNTAIQGQVPQFVGGVPPEPPAQIDPVAPVDAPMPAPPADEPIDYTAPGTVPPFPGAKLAGGGLFPACPPFYTAVRVPGLPDDLRGMYWVTCEPPSGPVSPPPASPPPPVEPPKPPCNCPPTVPPPPVCPPTCPDPPGLPPVEPTAPLWSTYGWGAVWSRKDVCQMLEQASHERRKPPEPAGPSPGRPHQSIDTPRDMLKSIGDFGRLAIEGLNSFGDEIVNTSIIPQTVGWMTEFALGHAVAEPIFAALDLRGVPEPAETSRLALKLGMVRFAENKTGIPLSYLTTTEQYLMHYLAPQYIPDQSALDGAYLANVITFDQWGCLTAAQGNIVETARWNLTVSQTRPDVHSVVRLNMRDYWSDPQRYLTEMREVGVTENQRIGEFEELAKFIPTAPDIITMMVRDVFDQGAVQRANLDKDFILKLYGKGGRDNPAPSAKWAKANGITEEVFRYFWRAHWVLPSNTQVYEMLHRLRPDRPEVARWDAMARERGIEETGALIGPRPIVFTLEDARSVLEQNDAAPAYIDGLLAISYNPMTRTDALNAFHANVMSSEQLFERLRDTGLDSATARDTVSIQDAMRARRTANVSGVWTIRKVARAYKDGALKGIDADALLIPLMPDPEQRARLMQGVDRELEADARSERVKRYQRAYYVGETDDDTTMRALLSTGIDERRAAAMLSLWDERRRGRYKEVSARMIVGWITQRILAPDVALERLSNLGYSNRDAVLIVQGALVAAGEKVEREIRGAQAEQRRIISSERQARRTAERELSERDKEIEKQMRALEKERARIIKELEDRRV